MEIARKELADVLPLTHSWPLFERDQRLDLGGLFDWRESAPADLALASQTLAEQGIGIWQCDLAESTLAWSVGVYDIFGLPRGALVTRDEAVALYAEHSRAAMERLRAYALRHRRGFTLDAEIIPAQGSRRWMRLVAAPICIAGRPVRLRGYKQDVTQLYL